MCSNLISILLALFAIFSTVSSANVYRTSSYDIEDFYELQTPSENSILLKFKEWLQNGFQLVVEVATEKIAVFSTQCHDLFSIYGQRLAIIFIILCISMMILAVVIMEIRHQQISRWSSTSVASPSQHLLNRRQSIDSTDTLPKMDNENDEEESIDVNEISKFLLQTPIPPLFHFTNFGVSDETATPLSIGAAKNKKYRISNDEAETPSKVKLFTSYKDMVNQYV
uniref:Uncharacterized protein n=1 Tax=Caenorhabditis japonica TaxID=281687 RepID=A0A8R1I9D4_CAEJA